MLRPSLQTMAGCGKQNAGSTAENKSDDKSAHKIALITDTIGTEQFILQAYHEMEKLSEEYGFEWSSIECADAAQWTENSEAASHEGYDLIIGLGWQAADSFGTLADAKSGYKSMQLLILYVLMTQLQVSDLRSGKALMYWEL